MMFSCFGLAGVQIWNLVKLLAPLMYSSALLAGGLLGYVMYDCTHYYLHHGKPSTGVSHHLKVRKLNNIMCFNSRVSSKRLTKLILRPCTYCIGRGFTWIITSKFKTKDLESRRHFGTGYSELFLP